MFGNTNNSSSNTGGPSGFSLFGNKPANNQTNATGNSSLGLNTNLSSLFGNKPSFGQTGNTNNNTNLFGLNSGNTGGSSLFGNSNNNNNNTTTFNTNINNDNNASNFTNGARSATLEESPFGIDLSFAKPTEMPQSITSKEVSNAPTGDDSFSSNTSFSQRSSKLKQKKKQSFSGSSSSQAAQSKTKLYHSNILNGIRNTKAKYRYSSISFGNKSADIISSSSYRMFSSTKDNSMLNLTPQKDNQYSSALAQQYSSPTFNFSTCNSNFQFDALYGKENRGGGSGETAISNLLVPHNQLSAPLRNNGEIKKLVIDPDISAAKRRKLLNGAKKSLKSKEHIEQHSVEEKPANEFSKKRFLSFGFGEIKSKLIDNNIANRPLAQIKRFGKQPADPANKEEDESLKIKELENFVDYSNPPNGYWCSPSVLKLASLPLADLASVDNFMIGRKDYGQIVFEESIDLVQFATVNPKYSTKLNLYNSLFTESFIIFRQNTAEVYPKDKEKPPFGQGLNVTAVVTLENMFPKKAQRSENGELSPDDIHRFISKLRKVPETKFINYVPGSGSWSFEVPHFSIWGLIDDSDDEEGGEEQKKEKNQPQVSKPRKQGDVKKSVISTTSTGESNTPAKKIEPEIAKKGVPVSNIKKRILLPQNTELKKVNLDELDKFAFKKLKLKNQDIPGSWNFRVSAAEELDDADQNQFVESVTPSEIETDDNIQGSELESNKDGEEEVEAGAETAHVSHDDEDEIVPDLGAQPSYANALVRASESVAELDSEDIEHLKQSILNTDLQEEELEGQLVSEKPYEPVFVSEKDLKLLEVDPTKTLQQLATDLPWEDAFCEGSTNVSVFNPKVQKVLSADIPKLPFAKSNVDKNEETSFSINALDHILFGDINELISENEKAREKLRFIKNKVFSKWDGATNLIFTNIIKNSAFPNEIQFFSIASKFGVNEGNSSLLDKIHENHLKLSLISKRSSNGFPEILPNKNLKFHFLFQSFAASFNLKLKQEASLWSLASILFDESSILENKKFADIKKITKPLARDHLIKIARIELLQGWIKTQLNGGKSVFNEEDFVTQEEQALKEIFWQVCNNEIKKASTLAEKTRNNHLSVLLSFLNSNDPNVKFGARKQLDYWVNNSSSNFISPYLLKIYKLLTGDFLSTVNHSKIDITEGLTWKQVYLLLISFGDTNKSLSELTQYFFDNYVDPKSVKFDLELGILKIFSLVNSNNLNYDAIENSLSSLQNYGPSPLDVRVQWYVYEFLIRSRLEGLESGKWLEKGDKLTMSFAEQLISGNKWEYALFVYLHLNNDVLAKNLISELIHKNIHQIVDFNDDLNEDSETKINHQSEGLNYLILKYQVPKKLVASAIALEYHYRGNFLNEAYSLLEAENWDDAHNIIVTKVAPNAIIGGGALLSKLLSLINRFPREVAQRFSFENKSHSLRVYKNYILLVQNNNDVAFTDSLIKYLVIHLPLVGKQNFETKVALNIISKFVIRKSFDFSRQNVEVRKLLELPLGQSDKNYVAKTYGSSRVA